MRTTKDGKSIEVTTTIHKDAVMESLRWLTIHNEAFDHRGWALWDADALERIAKMIRDGYKGDRP